MVSREMESPKDGGPATSPSLFLDNHVGRPVVLPAVVRRGHKCAHGNVYALQDSVLPRQLQVAARIDAEHYMYMPTISHRIHVILCC